MIDGTFPAKARRRLGVGLFAFLGLVLLPGCEPDPYPADLTYPFRADLLVDEATGGDIADTYRPGELEAQLAALKSLAENPPAGLKFSVFDPTELEDTERKVLRSVLRDTFGTPAAPRLFESESQLDEPSYIQDLQLDGPTLVKGSILYRRHCLHCHGVSGDGHGPTAAWINPPPRDFRRGEFKFTSVVAKNKPLRSDLERTLREGIEGTAMPNFRYLKEEESAALISYVIHLSIRGMTEYASIKETLKQDKTAKDPRGLVQTRLNEALKEWKEATPVKVLPWPKDYDDEAKFKASVGEGYKLFIGKGGCVKCHTDFGRQAKFNYDIWGTLVKPNNLTLGIYRGGRRPIDIYYRMAGGITPSTMLSLDLSGAGADKEIWALVNFVRAMPFPRMLPDDVRAQVYGGSGRK